MSPYCLGVKRRRSCMRLRITEASSGELTRVNLSALVAANTSSMSAICDKNSFAFCCSVRSKRRASSAARISSLALRCSAVSLLNGRAVANASSSKFARLNTSSVLNRWTSAGTNKLL